MGIKLVLVERVGGDMSQKLARNVPNIKKVPPIDSCHVRCSPNNTNPNMAVNIGSVDNNTVLSVAGTYPCAFCCNTSAIVPGNNALYSRIDITIGFFHAVDNP